VAREVLLERGSERVDFVLRGRCPERRIGIDPDQSADAVAKQERRLDDHIAAHRVADQHGVVKAQVLNNSCDVATERRHRPRCAAKTGLAVPREVDRHDAMVVGERRLAPPVRSVARPAVDEHERW
jgi:hypothetical protein